jgi:MFS family permease
MSPTITAPRREEPKTSPAAGPDRAAVPRRVAFWLLALVFAAVMLGTTLPTPLYVIYQARWHFSAAMVTVTFAVYAAGVLVTLLLAGRSSDQAGRKPVLAAALGASAVSTVVFILAPGLGALIAARIVSGLSAGLMTGTATAALTELVPAPASRRASLVATAANMGGLGLGPLIAGLFAQYAPHPTTLVFQVYLAVLAAAGLCLLFIPETVSPRRRPRSPPSPCSGCSPHWHPRSSGTCCTRTITPSRVPWCSCCSRWEPSPSSCYPGSPAVGSCWPAWACSWPRWP